MKYSALALLVGAAFAAQAAEPVTIYGKINLAVQSDDMGSYLSKNDKGEVVRNLSHTETSLKSHHSRLGFKGEQQLTDDLSAVYQYEVKVKMDDEDGTFGKRNQFVGIKSKAYGTFLLGRKDTAFKSSQGKIDMFGDIDGDITKLFVGENRAAEAFHYTSPKLADGQLKLAATYVLEEGDDNGYSLAANYGSAKYAEGKFYASVAYDYEVAGSTALRATGYTQVGNVRFGGMLQMQEDVNGDDGLGYMVNAAYLQGPLAYKVQFQSNDVELGKGAKGDLLNLGVDYKLGKSTTLYGVYTDSSLDSAYRADSTHIGFGMIQLF